MQAAPSTTSEVTATGSIPTATNLKVAFIGDTGDGDAFSSVIRLIKAEEADLVMHQGDFSYGTGPTVAWTAAIDQLGKAIPYLGADGNHDHWRQYTPFFERQIKKTGVTLTHGAVASGSYAITYKGLRIVLNPEGGDPSFNRSVLRQDDHIWKLCGWHHNRTDFQAGAKPDDVSLQTYQGCIDGGAIIATAHEHSYSRTYSLANLSAAQHGAFGDPKIMQIAKGNPGKSFIFVSGLGGRSSRDYHAAEHDDDGWWASIYTSNRYCKYTCTAPDFSQQDKSHDIGHYEYTWGVLFIVFNVDNSPYKARGYFKTITGEIIDEFTITADDGDKDRPSTPS
jgi:hypothetical protein